MPATTEVRAFGERRNNAELMRDCAALGYLNGEVLDATYGRGRFWNLHRPVDLTTNDLHAPGANHAYDYTDLPLEWADTFDTVVFDPPYKLNGTSTGKGPAASDASYGVTEYLPAEARHQNMRDGLSESARVARRFVLAKCQDQVCSGRVHWQTLILVAHAHTVSLDLVDMLHVVGYRPQPAGRTQVHSRRDYSTLLVFKKVPHARM